ncbi:NAD-dependent epimerase/dehydratase family protein [Kordiimonas marina]|uniref:NAD-dependent epimerase/dehydratase family protein n=1 Tax=Kordiimonas marina TaxID=2872312 RepID=UPI001FF3785C|nr:NAD-dependent epimerase/dehydratase family protein [Kordiimonas marina]MCJ9429964.1 NAD-dependent epimerase/dehydratase family protein [Kordiimonas marina]
MSETILVTGSAGFLGYHLAVALAGNPANRVICADNFIRGEDDALYQALLDRDNVTGLSLDLTDPAAVAKLPDDVDVVYHMAALNGTQNFYNCPFEVVRCCTLPTMHLLAKYGPLGRLRRFVYAGTSEAYASTVQTFGWEVPTAENVPVSFDDTYNARWSYGASKVHGEIAVIHASNEYKMPHTIARFHNAYGPRMGDKHVIPDFLMRAREGRFELYGWEDTRSFIYVDDAIAATIAMGESEACVNQTINLGGTREITMLELGKIIMETCGFEGEITCFPSPAGSVRRRCPDIRKLKSLTNFKENWSLERGLQATIDYYLSDQH